jgi:hypothetical protein
MQVHMRMALKFFVKACETWGGLVALVKVPHGGTKRASSSWRSSQPSARRQGWEFEPSEIPEGSHEYFRLQFQLPPLIAEILSSRQREEQEWMANIGIKRP